MAKRAGLVLALLTALGTTAVSTAHARQRLLGPYDASFTLHIVAGGPFSGSDYDATGSGSGTSELTASWTAPVILRVGDPATPAHTRPIIRAGTPFRGQDFGSKQLGTAVPVAAQPGPGRATFHGTAEFHGTLNHRDPPDNAFTCRYDVGGAEFGKFLEVAYHVHSRNHPLRAVTIEPSFHLTNKLGGVFYSYFVPGCDNPSYTPNQGVRPYGAILTSGEKAKEAIFSLPKLLAESRKKHNHGQTFTRTLPAGCSNCALPLEWTLTGTATITATAKFVKRR